MMPPFPKPPYFHHNMQSTEIMMQTLSVNSVIRDGQTLALTILFVCDQHIHTQNFTIQA